jgi:hypothetical protein
VSVQAYTLYVCRCTDGRFWPEQPRHVTCADCSAWIRPTKVIALNDALCYSPESIKAAA